MNESNTAEMRQNSPLSFAGHAVQRLTDHLMSDKIPLWTRASIASLEWHSVEGLQFAILPQAMLPKDLQRLSAKASVQIEYELIRIIGEVPLHYHDHSGGVINILPPETWGAEMYLGYWHEDGDWHKIAPKGELVVIPAGTIHGFRVKTNRFLTVVSVNIPPLPHDDVVYV